MRGAANGAADPGTRTDYDDVPESGVRPSGNRPVARGDLRAPAEERESSRQPDGHAATDAWGGGCVPHRLVAVWGPAGAPGRTVIAVNLAAESALLGRRVLLVDADTYAASVAASLGMLDEAAGLAQACRLADQGRLDAVGLRRCATAVSVAGASVDVLTGLTRHVLSLGSTLLWVHYAAILVRGP